MTYIKTDNITVSVMDTSNGFRKTNPTATVLFVHGWPLSHRIFDYQFNVLTQMGVRCVALDLRGFGLSDVPAYGYTYNNMAQDIFRVVSALGLNNFVLAGFSMGGAIAIRYMSLFKGYGVKKLALLAAAAPCFTKRNDFQCGMSVGDVNALIEQACTDRPKMAAQFGENMFAKAVSTEFRQWINSISFSASGIATIETAKALRDEDLRDDLKSIRVPTAIFHGCLDKICPFELAVEMNRVIRDSSIVPFINSGHGVFYDELEQFNKAFVEFVT